MTIHRLLGALPAALACCAAAFAVQAQQALPPDAPAGTTVQCKDGSYAAPDSKSGACRGHKGIQAWYGKGAAATPAPPAVETQSAAVSQTGVAPSTGRPSRTPARPDPAAIAAAPGGGAGKVWANDETHVYHCMGDRYYGKTKKGEYMTEADARAKGMHAARNKACG